MSTMAWLFSFFVGLQALAQGREIQFSWDPIEEARTYELEFHINGRSSTSIQRDSQFSGKVEFGVHKVRIRSRDFRNAPGDWSGWIPIVVKLPPLTIVKPKKRVRAKELDETEILFEWRPIPGVEKYSLTVFDSDGNELKSMETDSAQARVSLDVGQKYQWSVAPVTDLVSETEQKNAFRISGGKLSPPEVEKVDEFSKVSQLQWQAAERAKKYDVALLRKKGTKWRVVKIAKRTEATTLDLKEPLKPGQYQVRVRSRARGFLSSDFNNVNFNIFEDREPASVDEFALKKKPRKNFYYLLRYRASTPEYKSVTYDLTNSLSPEFKFRSPPLTGSGRFGFGYDSDFENWGALMAIELSGFSSSASSNDGFDLFNYAGAEASAFRKFNVTDFSWFRMYGGVVYQEVPFLKTDELGNPAGAASVSYLGPLLGVDYSGALTRSLGWKVNAQITMPLATLSSPNQKDITPSVNQEFGVSGSWQLSGRTTGFLGIAFYNEHLKFPSLSGAQKNEVSIKGQFLNLMIETDY